MWTRWEIDVVEATEIEFRGGGEGENWVAGEKIGRRSAWGILEQVKFVSPRRTKTFARLSPA